VSTTGSAAGRPTLAQACGEFASFLRRSPPPPLDALIAGAPRGDGHAVLVLPAVLRGDPYTAAFRSLLAAIGYRPYGWELGVNIGPTPRLLAGMLDRLQALSDRHGPVSLVGFSMGGLFARWLSHRAGAQVRRVITVCSPFRDPADSLVLPAAPLLRLWPGLDLPALADEVARPLAVPGTFLFCRSDGVVNWMRCREPAPGADNIEITGRHVLIAQNPEVLRILADVLARPAGRDGDRGVVP